MSETDTKNFHFGDAAIRLVEERDIPAISNLFRMNYGDTYPYKEVYDERWIKKSIYGDGTICIVLEEDGEVLASGAVMLDYGDNNDQIGEIARLVVHTEHKGKRLGNRIINALFEIAGENVEFAFGVSRTANTFSQMTMVRAGFSAVGFLPPDIFLNHKNEHLILVIKLHGNGALLRSDELPQVIPEVAPLAGYVLRTMNLPDAFNVVEDCQPYQPELLCTTQQFNRDALAKLVRIEHGRVVEPLLFGGVTLDQGFSYIKRRNAVYLMAVDEDDQPVGAVGYQHDAVSKTVKGIEIVAKSEQLRGRLCGSLLREAARLGAEVIEVNVSAYDARLQRTFADEGFHPVAYMPAMVFHGTQRLDVVKMLKLNVPYQRGEMKLTEPAEVVVNIVERNFI